MNLKLALLFILASLSQPSHALYGGRPVTKDLASEAVVSLHLRDADYQEYDYFCSGVLVSPTRVLTTGHCITRMGNEVYDKWSKFIYEPQTLIVRINGKEHVVKDVNLAPSYTEHSTFLGEDLAMLDLAKPSSVKPLVLAKATDLSAGNKVRMIARKKEAFTVIKKTKLYGPNLVIFTNGSRAGICQGDSGGALLIEKGGNTLLAGILSAQEDGCVRMTGVSHFPKLAL